MLVGLQAEVGTYYVCMKNIGDMPMMIASLYVPEMLLACLLLVTSLLIIALVVPRLSRRILNGQRLQDHCPEYPHHMGLSFMGVVWHTALLLQGTGLLRNRSSRLSTPSTERSSFFFFPGL